MSSKIKHPEIVRRKLKTGAGQPMIYLILVNDKAAEKIEICHSALMLQEYYRSNPPMILGIAEGKEDAVLMLADMVKEAIRQTGRPDVYGWLFPHGIRCTGGAER